jgi:hypothetical protein
MKHVLGSKGSTSFEVETPLAKAGVEVATMPIKRATTTFAAGTKLL